MKRKTSAKVTPSRRKAAHSKGVRLLFVGGTRTGKTIAARALANGLGLDLYQLDLSAVTGKYISDTEKNLRRVFEEVEASGTVLLLDEADALFGKRTTVRDAHDRYRHVEMDCLLRRIEKFYGIAILSAASRKNFDAAFLRRFDFIIPISRGKPAGRRSP